MNRIDEVIVFNNFSLDEIKFLVNEEISKLKRLLKSQKSIKLNVESDVIESISNHVFNLKMGARPIKRIIQKNIENKVSQFIIKNKKGEVSIKISDINYE